MLAASKWTEEQRLAANQRIPETKAEREEEWAFNLHNNN